MFMSIINKLYYSFMTFKLYFDKSTRHTMIDFFIVTDISCEVIFLQTTASVTENTLLGFLSVFESLHSYFI